MRSTVETTLAHARRMGARRAVAMCQCFQGALEYQAGHWDESEDALRDSIELHRRIGAASGESLACQRLGVLLTAQDRLDEGLAAIEEAIESGERALLRAHCLTRAYAALAQNRLAAGDIAASTLALEEGLSLSARHGNCSTCDSLLLPAAASVRIAQGDLAAAAEATIRLEEAAHRYGSRTWLAMAAQVRGEVAAVSGKAAEAMASYEEAEEGFRESGFPAEAARCQAALAALRQLSGKREDAELASRLDAESRTVFQSLGAAGLERERLRIASLLGQANRARSTSS